MTRVVHALPLEVRPESRDRSDVGTLTKSIDERRDDIQAWLARHGAILFRGFHVATPNDFERVARAVTPDLANDYLGTSPRNALTEVVFTASELPEFYPIPQHIEMSFLAHPPRTILFHAQRANQGRGGETPLVDFRAVWRDLEPSVRDQFAKKGVRHVRNYIGPESKRGRFDLWKLKRWDELFGTTDRAIVEQKCASNGITHEWLPGDRLRLTNTQPAARNHPVTGEPVWFNHAQVFHLSAAAGELDRVSRLPGQTRSALLAAFAKAAVTAKRLTTKDNDQAMHATFGDGTPISDSAMESVRDAIWQNLVIQPWQTGDVIVIDNTAVGHGRIPYRGPRQISVAWS